MLRTIMISIVICLAQEGKAQATAPIDSTKGINPAKHRIIRQYIVGKWKDQNSTTTILENGKFTTVFDSGGIVTSGTWELAPGKLRFYDDDLLGGLGIPWTYNILHFTPLVFKMQLNNSEDTTIWISRRIRE